MRQMTSTLFFSASLFLSSAIYAAAATETGALTKAKQKISASALVGAQNYSNFIEQLNSTTQDGPKSLKLLSQATGPMSEKLSNGVSDQTRAAVGLNKYDGVQEFLMDSKNKWAFPLYDYTQGGENDEEPVYSRVNKDLRDTATPDSKETVKWVKSMRKALSLLPAYEGISFRGTRLTSDRIEKFYPTNGVAVDSAFISTSVSPGVAVKFATSDANDGAGLTDKVDGKISVLFIINGKSGRPVSSFAISHASEEEVLFANGTKMKVISKTPIFEDAILGKTVVVRLEEM